MKKAKIKAKNTNKPGATRPTPGPCGYLTAPFMQSNMDVPKLVRADNHFHTSFGMCLRVRPCGSDIVVVWFGFFV